MIEDLFIEAPTTINAPPTNGYTYIYAYSIDNLFLYVGQTIKSIDTRFLEHLKDSSGAKYANTVFYFQIRSEYANYAEGLTGRRLRGVCQGELPEPERWRTNIDNEVKKALQLVGKKLSEFRSHNCIKFDDVPIFTHKKSTYASKEHLKLLTELCNEENNLLQKHFSISIKTRGFNEVRVFKSLYRDIQAYILENDADGRPIYFCEINSVKDLKRIKNLRTNFPAYGIIKFSLFNKNQDVVNEIIQKSTLGFLVRWNEQCILYKKWEKPLKRNNYDIRADFIVSCSDEYEPYYILRMNRHKKFQCA